MYFTDMYISVNARFLIKLSKRLYWPVRITFLKKLCQKVFSIALKSITGIATKGNLKIIVQV